LITSVETARRRGVASIGLTPDPIAVGSGRARYLVGSYGLLSPTAGLIMRRLFVIVAGCLASVGAAAAGDRETEGSSAALVLHRQ
jgi:hypothetical protein